MLPHLAKLKGTVLDLFFPRWCIACGREGKLICSNCQRQLQPVLPPVCPRCGLPRDDDRSCPDCVNWQGEIDGIRSVFRFEGLLRDGIYDLKYHNLRAIATEFSKLMAQYQNKYLLEGDILVPVPLHPRRLRERGYNQSGLLAQELAGLCNLDYNDRSLIRCLDTPSQTTLANVKARWQNMSGAFKCRDTLLSGSRVIVIDDVATSGATLNACAGALKDSGAVSVWGLTLAREL